MGTLGTASRNTSSCFATKLLIKKLTPVRLPPGRFRLATRPNLIGSAPIAKTIGMTAEAALAAMAPAVLVTAITDTCRRTKSAAKDGNLS
jgi:hypothetical protein